MKALLSILYLNIPFIHIIFICLYIYIYKVLNIAAVEASCDF